ncbi:MAG TPA: sugar transferase [Solirubrobacterales bacterium]|nr:sugar transferase [Solirubrobacterales bacterium]
MESSTATHAHGEAAVEADQTGTTQPNTHGAASRARRRGAVLARMLFTADSVAACLAAAIAVFVLGLSSTELSGAAYVAGATLLWPFAAFSIGLYRSDQLASWASAVSEIPRAFVAILLITWPLFGLASILGLEQVIGVTFLTVSGIAGLTGIARTIVRAGLHRDPDLRQRTLILGSGFVAGQVVKKLHNNVQFGLVPVGIVDDEVHDVGSPDLPWLGRFTDLDTIIEAQGIDRVIIAFSKASHEQLLESIRACRDAGVTVDVVPRLFEFLDGVRALDQVGGLPLLSIGTPVLTSASIAAKRLLDAAGSLALILAFSPLMIAIAIAIKLESRGPIFFRQPRAGRGNTSFQLIKFRSMYVDAEKRKSEISELNEAGDGVMFKIRKDPRVTRVGQFIRRFSIDELPQLFNVLRGEMSLVGPRPLIFPETAALDEDWHLRRLELRPGLTGPWQVYGRSQSPFQEMVRFDYQYVAGWSLARDVEILLATLPAVLSGRGAY